MEWFKNLQTRAKLMYGFSVLCVLMIAIGWINGTHLTGMQGDLRVLYEEYTTVSIDLARLATVVDRYRSVVVMALNSPNKVEFDQLTGELDPLKGNIRQLLEKISWMAGNEREQKNDFMRFRDALEAYLAATEITISASREAMTAATPDEAAAWRTKGGANARQNAGPKFNAMTEALTDLLTSIDGSAKAKNIAGQQSASQATWMAILGLGVVILFSLILGYAIGRLIAEPLQRAVRVLDAVAAGDLTQRLAANTTDEVGQLARALNEAVSSLGGVMSKVGKKVPVNFKSYATSRAL